jgi:hypothetical protein
MSGYSPEFDWNPKDDEEHDIVLRLQPAIAVYLNPHDEVVIRQQDQFDVSEDHFVFITKGNVLKVVERTLAVAGIERIEDCGLDEPLLLPALKDRTGSERQRRYRNRHRNGDGRDVTGDLPLLLAHGAEHQQELAG